MTRGILVYALLALCGIVAPVEAQEVVYVVRHAEQQGMTADASLTDAGHRRARALAVILEHAGITAVYSSELLRTRQTAQPLADALGLEIQQVQRTDIDGLVTRIRREAPHGRVLIVGHTQTIPLILRALGHPDEIVIDMDDYDDLFLVVPDRSTQPVLLRLRFTLAAGN